MAGVMVREVADGSTLPSTPQQQQPPAYSLRGARSRTRPVAAGCFCDEGHPLHEITWASLRTTPDSVYSQRFFCDLCRKENGLNFLLADTDVLYHCSECSFAVCPSCIKRRQHLLIRGAHVKDLKSAMQFRKPEPRFEHLHCHAHAAFSFNMKRLDVDDPQLLQPEFCCRTCQHRGSPPFALASGDWVLVCASPVCSYTICMDCAEFLIRREREPPLAFERSKTFDLMLRSRYCRHTHLMRPTVFANVRAKPDSPGKGFVCEYCESWFDRPDPETLLFQCEDCSTFQCCKCFFQTKPHGGLPLVQSSRLKQGVSAKKLASRLDSVLARRQEKSKSLLPLPPELPVDETFRMLELRLHRLPRLHDGIVYELERRSLQQAEETLNPFILEQLRHCKWPIHTALRLIALCKQRRSDHPESSEILDCEIIHLEKLSFDMLNELDIRDVSTLFRASSPSKRFYRIKSLLTLAKEADHKKFLAHKSVHHAFRSQWENSVLPNCEDATTGLLFTGYITWCLLSIFFLIINFFSAGALARFSLKTFEKRRWLAAILGPLNKERSSTRNSTPSPTASARKLPAQFHNRPRLWLERWAISYKRKWRLTPSVRARFCVHLLAYCGFLAVASYVACLPSSTEIRLSELALGVWVVGLLLLEVEQIKHSGVAEHFNDFWNKVDIVHVFLYIAVLCTKALAAIYTTHSSLLLSIYDSSFACVLIVSYVRILYAFQAFRGVGPLLVVFGKMVGDVLRFISLVAVILVGFAFSLFKLYQGTNIAFAGPENSSFSSGRQSGSSSEFANVLRSSFLQTFASLYFAIVGTADIDLGSGYKSILGNVIVGVFMVVTTMVLVNLLIAMMSSSFQRVEQQADNEWKANFASIVTDFGNTSVVPMPLNIVSWVGWLLITPLVKLVFGCGSLCFRLGQRSGARRKSIAKYIHDDGNEADASQLQPGEEDESDDDDDDDDGDSDYDDEAEQRKKQSETSVDSSRGDSFFVTEDARHEIAVELRDLEAEAAEQQEEDEEEGLLDRTTVLDAQNNVHRDTSFAEYVHGLSRELFQEGLEAEASARQHIQRLLNKFASTIAAQPPQLEELHASPIAVASALRRLQLTRPAGGDTDDDDAGTSATEEAKRLLRKAVTSLLSEWPTTSLPAAGSPPAVTQRRHHHHRKHHPDDQQ